MSQPQYHQTAYARVHAMDCSSAPTCLQLLNAEEVLHYSCGCGYGTKVHATLASGAVLRSQPYMKWNKPCQSDTQPFPTAVGAPEKTLETATSIPEG